MILLFNTEKYNLFSGKTTGIFLWTSVGILSVLKKLFQQRKDACSDKERKLPYEHCSIWFFDGYLAKASWCFSVAHSFC